MKWLFALVLAIALPLQAQPLPSWNESASKQAILAFVKKTTTPGSPEFIPPAERIAVFDNDGTLWSEQPNYVQLAFILDRVKALAPQHPEWKTTQPFKAVIEQDWATLKGLDEHELVKLVAATHSGMNSEEFSTLVTDWLKTARHPKTGRPYTQMVYQPMIELLDYLRAHQYKTYIVSGGGVDFIRPWSEQVYGVPPEQVVGSAVVTRFALKDGRPVLDRLAEIDFINDKAGKPVGIHRHIGRRPVIAVGNSDGDLQMLQWTSAGSGPRLGLIVHHTDAQREVAYDRQSSVGRLDAALDQAPGAGWKLIDMKQDWKTVFPQ